MRRLTQTHKLKQQRWKVSFYFREICPTTIHWENSQWSFSRPYAMAGCSEEWCQVCNAEGWIFSCLFLWKYYLVFFLFYTLSTSKLDWWSADPCIKIDLMRHVCVVQKTLVRHHFICAFSRLGTDHHWVLKISTLTVKVMCLHVLRR